MSILVASLFFGPFGRGYPTPIMTHWVPAFEVISQKCDLYFFWLPLVYYFTMKIDIISEIESKKTTSMKYVSTVVFEKIKKI